MKGNEENKKVVQEIARYLYIYIYNYICTFMLSKDCKIENQLVRNVPQTYTGSRVIIFFLFWFREVPVANLSIVRCSYRSFVISQGSSYYMAFFLISNIFYFHMYTSLRVGTYINIAIVAYV
jgi:hypothetical protein